MESKKWYKSKSIWAGIFTAVVGAAQAICMQFGFDLLAHPLSSLVLTIAGALGIYGRVTANTTVTK